MTTETNILVEDNTPAPASTPEAKPSVPAELNELVGEGKKYKTPADLAKAMAEKDAFIEQLKNENAGMREDLSQREETRKALEDLKALRNKPKDDSEVNTTPALGQADVEKMLEEAIARRETEAQRKANLNEANELLLKAFGDQAKAKEAVEKRAAELNMSVNDIVTMAAKSPKAVVSIFGLQGRPEAKPLSESKSSVNTVNLGQNSGSPQERLASLNALRKTNTRQYWSPRVQNEIMRLTAELRKGA